MSFLTPGFFDAVVLLLIVVGFVLAAIRVYRDFQRGPRWADSAAELSDAASEPHASITNNEIDNSTGTSNNNSNIGNNRSDNQ